MNISHALLKQKLDEGLDWAFIRKDDADQEEKVSFHSNAEAVLVAAYNEPRSIIRRTWSLYQEALRGRSVEELAEAVVGDTMRLCNYFGGDRELAKALSSELEVEHRTVQQSFMGVVRKVIHNYARHGYDGRNEASVRWAEKVQRADAEAGQDLMGFPHI